MSLDGVFFTDLFDLPCGACGWDAGVPTELSLCPETLSRLSDLADPARDGGFESIHETMYNFTPKTRLAINEKIIIFGRH